MKQIRNKFFEEMNDEGGIWELWVFAIVFILIFCVVARAEAAESTLATEASPELSTLVEAKKEGPIKIGGGLLVETSATVDTESPTNYTGLYRLSGSVAHIPTGVSLGISADYGREYSYERDDQRDGDLDSMVVSAKKTWKKPLTFLDEAAISLSTALPVSREHRRRTFQGSLGSSISGKKKIGRLGLEEVLSYTYGFYEYDIRDNGVVNSPHSFRLMTNASLELMDALALSGSLWYTRAVSFQNVGKDSVLAAVSLDYQASEKLGFSLGIGTEKGTATPDGQSNRIFFYDPESTTAFLDVSISI